ncbi:Inner membrane protein YnbA [Polystyrenella longa]|uniref:Inner membrane protein YnbA n=1 Tax=Polystyrenella longa TaxID=2528007 RepID=A0A518CRK4_9PLAN|nr:CDP-alcohol phosphatidyltransferase family protein [Polystyrenella longa]QDU81861.1 Inner membrane protein YnbA [Polystyrenella longa]
MASIYDLKPRFQGLLRPLSDKLATIGCTANQVTVLAVVCSLIVGALIALNPNEHWPLLVLPPFLFFRMALNAIDGMLAREHNMKSNLGLVLNELGDVVADAGLYLPLALISGVSGELVTIIVLLSVMSEMTGVIGVQLGTTRRYEGPLGKSDRAFLFGFLALLIGLGIQPQPWVDYVLWMMILLLILTIVNRARKSLSEVESTGDRPTEDSAKPV